MLRKLFSLTRRISAADAVFDDPEQLLRLIEPYLEWVLADVDTLTLAILLRNPQTSVNTSKGVISSSYAVGWSISGFSIGARHFYSKLNPQCERPAE
jgi:hypothetical protein